jgi:hypothetical protein
LRFIARLGLCLKENQRSSVAGIAAGQQDGLQRQDNDLQLRRPEPVAEKDARPIAQSASSQFHIHGNGPVELDVGSQWLDALQKGH